MVIHSLAVIVALWVPSLLLVLGFERYRERSETYVPYRSVFTGLVLIAVGCWCLLIM